MSERIIALPEFHAAQKAVYRRLKRFNVLCCGRRWGKGIFSAIVELMTASDGGKCWHLSPDYPQAGIHWRLVSGLAKQIHGASLRESDRTITFEHGGYLQIKSAESANLVGEGLHLLTVDEAARIPKLLELWNNELRPMLSDYQGRALFTSTPRGVANDFHTLFSYGRDRVPDWYSIQLPTSTNPRIRPEELQAARSQMPERAFRENYLAEFLPDGAGVFRNLRELSTAGRQDGARDGGRYIVGIDVGRTNDYTAIVVIDTAKQPAEVCYVDRFTDLEFAVQLTRIKAVADRFKPTRIIVEANNFGQALIEQAHRAGIANLRAVTTSNQSKSEAVDALALALERADLLLPSWDDVLMHELSSIESERLPSGLVRYAAGRGHDDAFMSLLMAWSEFRQADRQTIHAMPNPFYEVPISVQNARIGTVDATSGVLTAKQVSEAAQNQKPPHVALDVQIEGDTVLAPTFTVWQGLIACLKCYGYVDTLHYHNHSFVCSDCKERG